MENIFVISLCLCISAVGMGVIGYFIWGSSRKYYLILEDKRKRVELKITSGEVEKSLDSKVLNRGNWAVGILDDSGRIKQTDLINILRSLKETGIKELQINKLQDKISHLWLSEIKTLRTVSLMNTEITHEIINEIGKVHAIEGLKISGEGTRWKKTNSYATLNESITDLAVENTKEEFMKRFLDTNHFKNIQKISLNRTGISSFDKLRNKDISKMKSIEIQNETVKEDFLPFFTELKKIEKLVLLGIEVKQQNATRIIRKSKIFTYPNLYYFEIDEHLLMRTFKPNDIFQTEKKSITVKIHCTEERNYSVEYKSITEQETEEPHTASTVSAIKVKIAPLPDIENIAQNQKTNQLKIRKFKRNTVMFMDTLEVKDLQIEVEVNRPEDILNRISSILQEAENYDLERISIYFKYPCAMDKPYIEKIISKDTHKSLSDLLITNIRLQSTSHPEENNRPIRIHLKHSSKEEKNSLWTVFEKEPV